MTKQSIPSVEPLPSASGFRKIDSWAEVLSSKTQWRIYLGALLVSDLLMTGFAFLAAFYIRFNLELPIFNLEITPSFPFYQSLSISLLPLWIFIYFLNGLYNRDTLLGGTQEYASIFRSATVGMLLIIIVGFLEPIFIIARGWLLLAWVLTFFLNMVGRFFLRRLVYSLRMRGYYLSPALIVGANDEGRLLAEQLRGWRRSGLNIIGFIDEQRPVGTPITQHLTVLGKIENSRDIIAANGVEELILATSAMDRPTMLDLFQRYGVSDQVNLRLSSGLFEIITTGLQVKEIAYVPLVRVNKVRLAGIDEILKWLLDYSLALPGLVLASPILLILAILIKLDSPGPVIHRRRVMGLNGTQFDAFKFRTMFVDGNDILEMYPDLKVELARNHKLKTDPRVTRLGRILRKYSLDELPQLFNVLRREMSLVGPRMITPAEMHQYNQWGINLLTVRPGITGLWQVSGRSDINYQKRVQLDMQYIRNWSIWLDIQLILRTIPVVFKGSGAY
jgi:exopolysaccharide biosynthesis polyprenyl glycosylphosphotransferase